ncbi:peptidase S8/S53 domain-containing protein [Daldinia vernicosa]|uniref:peptidase S8/S53 domain-containing protein n=1 Tax=Daldinia vernicosa TaxID=114800 RepID=UPI0020074946|nr:peptidase S8/S53 domain-containing protein [Daldinia vernicosa]KAI0844918.1 peptidase S8/S53 domain-containing protein [Daldinia vernicosa]
MAEIKGPRKDRRQPRPQEKKTRSMSRHRNERRQQSNCSEIGTPECIAKLHDIPPADKAHPNMWMKLGLQGVTVVGSAGNSGPLATRQCMPSNFGTFYASHPGSCPYVTSVGATMLLSNRSQTVAKDTNWASSGGFSWYYPTPASGSGLPDISALDKNVAVAVLGELDVADGTSAATPLVGAIFNRINEERLAVGKSTVGFVNPVLYANPGMFDDLVTGDNSMCDIEGFNAVKG